MSRKLPNIILILCDTLGAKHMSLYGYKRETTPNLKRLVEKEGWAVYKRCFAPAPWTTPSHASLFTGLYPSEHGIHGGNFFLDSSLNSIATLLQQVGYNTIAISNNSMISRFFQFDAGFEIFSEMFRLFPNEDLVREEREIKKIINSHGKDLYKNTVRLLLSNKYLLKYFKIILAKLYNKKFSVIRNATPFTKKTFHQLIKDISYLSNPYFIFVNIMQTHGKYNPPVPYKGKFSNIFKGENFETIYKFSSEEIWFEYYLKNPGWQNYLEYLKALYDEEVLFLDDILTQFIQEFKKQKEYKDTIIIITSDHGELFGEHGHVHHIFTTYNELIYVPLLIKYPKDYNIKGEINNLTQLQDIYSTFFDIAAIPFPSPISSKSLLNSEKRKVAISQLVDVNFKIEALKNRNPNFIAKGFMQPMISVITDDFWKITKRLDGYIEVYNLCNDLYETEDLSKDNFFSDKVIKLKELIKLIEKVTGFDKVIQEFDE